MKRSIVSQCFVAALTKAYPRLTDRSAIGQAGRLSGACYPKHIVAGLRRALLKEMKRVDKPGSFGKKMGHVREGFCTFVLYIYSVRFKVSHGPKEVAVK